MAETDENIDLTLDLDGMTLGELETLEDYTGLSIDDLNQMRQSGQMQMSSKLITYFVWLTNHRKDPKYTMEQARNTNISRLNFGQADDDEDEPETPAQKSAKKKPRRAKSNAAS